MTHRFRLVLVAPAYFLLFAAWAATEGVLFGAPAARQVWDAGRRHFRRSWRGRK